ncbi:MAG: transposase [Candidatus Omnitrophota bacterium]|nr:transposase [Candidatus Omnitrophota bacterium]
MALTITHAKRERFNCKNAIYHIVTRCNNKESLIKNELDFIKYKFVLKKCKEKYGFLLHDYAIMNNHAHLLIKLFTAINISQIMHSIDRRYALWYNGSYKRKGHFWEDRFYGELIKDDIQLLAVMRYIDLNPVKANLCKDPTEWPYSGARFYLNGVKDELLDVPEIYTNLGDTAETRQKTYSFIFPSILTRLK